MLKNFKLQQKQNSKSQELMHTHFTFVIVEALVLSIPQG